MPNAPQPRDAAPRPQAPVRRRLGNGRNGQAAGGRGARAHAGAADRNGFRDLRIVGVHKSFGESKVLHGVDLSIESGRTLSLLGPSGCGKTTLMRIVSGLEAADRGEVHVGERLLAGPGVHTAPESRRIGLLGQERSLFPHLSVGANAAYGLGRSFDRATRVREVLDMVDLAGFEKRMPDSLSGGQQQRVAIARALAPRPRMLLLDEPFQALDVHLRLELQAEVRTLLAALGATAVIVTHDQDEAFVMGDEVAVMQEGHIRQRGTPSEVYGHPASPWVASFVGDANFIPGLGSGATVATPLGSLATCCPVSGEVAVLVRPSHLRLDAPAEDQRDTAAVGQVEAMRFYGPATECRVQIGGDILLARSDRMPSVRVGDDVALSYTGPPAVAYPASAMAGLRRNGRQRHPERPNPAP
ncbi:MAG: ABC transporter ATP-binding protein [bacterium]|nr:ABC transporter ATP-binding protein [bacterium]